jgi:hypothetical protein
MKLKKKNRVFGESSASEAKKEELSLQLAAASDTKIHVIPIMMATEKWSISILLSTISQDPRRALNH